MRYAAIAGAVPTAVTAEPSATWAYPQREWSDEINALTVLYGLLGRMYLSWGLDELEDIQLDLVCCGMRVWKGIRVDIGKGLPYWPLGLPAWHDGRILFGMSTSKQ